MFSIIAGPYAISHAAVIARDWQTPGDKLLTYDEVNRREWLDLSVSDTTLYFGTVEMKYQAVIARTAPGGDLVGFEPANHADVVALGASAGIDTGTSNFAVNQQAAFDLIELVGLTYISNADYNRYSMGYTADQVRTQVTEVFHLRATREADIAGVRSHWFISGHPGVWLYRQVPEPGCAVLAVVCCSGWARGPACRVGDQRCALVPAPLSCGG